jgi:multicomponent Na+:H+ antiporter subunit D
MLTYLFLPFFITENYLLITALIPLLSALAIFFTSKWPKVSSSVTVASSMLLFVYTSLCTLYLVYGDHSQFILMDFGNNLHISLKLESTGVIFSLLISFLWIPTSIYAICYMQNNYADSNRSRFLCFFQYRLAMRCLLLFLEICSLHLFFMSF